MKFVVYDDHKEFRDTIESIIKSLNYEDSIIKLYSKYDEKLKEEIKNDQKKIYILDIEVPNSISGLELARKIRMTDWKSVIIMVTSHNELGYEALKSQIMLLDFISKFSPTWKTNLKNTIKKAMNKTKEIPVLILETPNMIYIIYTDDILYILRDQVERKCKIKTINDEIYFPKSIKEFSALLDDRFFLSHRSCYINLKQVKKVDFKKLRIYFNNGEFIDYLSRDKKKELKEYVRNN